MSATNSRSCIDSIFWWQIRHVSWVSWIVSVHDFCLQLQDAASLICYYGKMVETKWQCFLPYFRRGRRTRHVALHRWHVASLIASDVFWHFWCSIPMRLSQFLRGFGLNLEPDGRCMGRQESYFFPKDILWVVKVSAFCLVRCQSVKSGCWGPADFENPADAVRAGFTKHQVA